MPYGTMREPGFEARLEEARLEQVDRAREAQQHVAALLRGAKATEEANPLLARLVVAVERIAAAQERAYPDTPPVIAPV